MNPLQYTSEEMFSSTELIRKSKSVFDKLHKKDIEKAIILRDGKPAFMLLDFSVYENLMSEYISLKELLDNPKEKSNQKTEVEKEENNTNVEIQKVSESKKELSEKDLEEALAEIDDLNLDEIEDKESLKEFWE